MTGFIEVTKLTNKVRMKRMTGNDCNEWDDYNNWDDRE